MRMGLFTTLLENLSLEVTPRQVEKALAWIDFLFQILSLISFHLVHNVFVFIAEKIEVFDSLF